MRIFTQNLVFLSGHLSGHLELTSGRLVEKIVIFHEKCMQTTIFWIYLKIVRNATNYESFDTKMTGQLQLTTGQYAK